jgi:hypothetical protein
VGQTVGVAAAVGGCGAAFRLKFHQALRRKTNHPAQEVCAGNLLQKLSQVHVARGHCRSSVRVKARNQSLTGGSQRPLLWISGPPAPDLDGRFGAPLNHSALQHSLGDNQLRARNDPRIRLATDYHLNNVNAYRGRSKEWLRRFHGVAMKNLPNYLGCVARWRHWTQCNVDQNDPRHDRNRPYQQMPPYERK